MDKDKVQCPLCKDYNSRVIDTRFSKRHLGIRRRRVYIKCEYRFTTIEITVNELRSLRRNQSHRA